MTLLALEWNVRVPLAPVWGYMQLYQEREVYDLVRFMYDTRCD